MAFNASVVQHHSNPFMFHWSECSRPLKGICMVPRCVRSPSSLREHLMKLHVLLGCSLCCLCFRTVVKCNIAKSQALYSAQRGLKTNNAAVFKVGAIVINIPQHPATLHSMMVRSSHQLSKQISDLIRQPSSTCVCSAFLLTTT